MRDVLYVLGIPSKRYTTTTTTTTRRSLRIITTEQVMQQTPRNDDESASTYVSRIDAMVDAIIDERD
jgi:hypothetical protein